MSNQRDDILDAFKDVLEYAMQDFYGPGHGCSRDFTAPDFETVGAESLPYLWIPAPESELDAAVNDECNGDIFESIPLEIVGRVARNSDDADSITESRCNELLQVIEPYIGVNLTLSTTSVTVRRDGTVKRYLPKDMGALMVPVRLHYARTLLS